MEASERQKLRMKARVRATERLIKENPERFEELYEEECQKVGYERKYIVTRREK